MPPAIHNSSTTKYTQTKCIPLCVQSMPSAKFICILIATRQQLNIHKQNVYLDLRVQSMPSAFIDTDEPSVLILECRKFSCTSGVPEIFLHFWSAGNFPALLECRKFSCTSGVPEIFLHFWSAGNFPAFLECRNFPAFQEYFLSASVHLYIINHFCSTLVPTLFSFSICMSTFVGHMFLHFSLFTWALL